MSGPAIPPPVYPEIDDPSRPAWHFHPPAGWMNDPNGVAWHEDWCHVFYQHNPGGDEWADMHWGHARSRDFMHWEHLPLALRPQRADREKHCYSGCLARTAAGEARILYTSVSPAPGPATQVLATPDDPTWHAWTQHVTTPMLDLATHGGPAFGSDWRDPFVFHDDDRTFLILGATLGDEAVIPIYENLDGDLQRWIYRGIIYREPLSQTRFLECPNLIPLDGKWLLLTSPCRQVEWFTGTLDLARPQFHVERRGRVDESADYYATHPLIDPQGRVVLFGWARNFPRNRGWNGCLATPRHLWLDDFGELCSRPIDEIASLRTAISLWPTVELSAIPARYSLPSELMAEGEVILERKNNATIACNIAGCRFAFGPHGVDFDGKPTISLGKHCARIELRWLLDHSLFEIFVNDHIVHTCVLDFPCDPVVTFSCAEGAAQLTRGSVWTLRVAPSTLA